MFFSFPTKECCNHIKECGVQNLPSLTTNKTKEKKVTDHHRRNENISFSVSSQIHCISEQDKVKF